MKQGNYLIEFSLSFENLGTCTHLIGTWINSNEDYIEGDAVLWFEKYVLPTINEDIRAFEEELEERELII